MVLIRVRDKFSLTPLSREGRGCGRFQTESGGGTAVRKGRGSRASEPGKAEGLSTPIGLMDESLATDMLRQGPDRPGLRRIFTAFWKRIFTTFYPIIHRIETSLWVSQTRDPLLSLLACLIENVPSPFSSLSFCLCKVGIIIVSTP